MAIMQAAVIRLAGAEEKSILDNATMSWNEVDSSWTWNTKAGIDGGFRSFLYSGETNPSSGSKEFVFNTPDSHTIMTAFIQNRDWRTDRLGKSHIWVGNDISAYSALLIKCSGEIFDTGFFEMAQPCTGMQFVIRRDGYSWRGPSDIHYQLNELRLYQTPNLLKTYIGQV